MVFRIGIEVPGNLVDVHTYCFDLTSQRGQFLQQKISSVIMHQYPNGPVQKNFADGAAH